MPSCAPSYLAVLRTPYAARTFAAALIGRLSYGVVFLSFVLAVTHATGSVTVAGTFTALYGLTSSVLSPPRARLIDRLGLRRALTPMAVAYTAALAVIAAVTRQPGASPALLCGLAVVAGALTPPLGPIMRSLWTLLADGEDLRRRAFSLDTVGEELLYVTGPLLAGVLAAVAGPALGVAVSVGLILAGSLLLLTSPVTRGAGRPRPASAAGAPAPSIAGMGGPVLVAAAMGLGLGALSLLAVAFVSRAQHLAAVAWVEAALAVGSVAGGLAYGAIRWRSPAGVRLPLLAAAAGAALASAGLAANLLTLIVLAAVIGLFVSPALTTAYLLADDTAGPGARVQAGARVNTAFNLANSVGAAMAGILLDRLSLPWCFAIVAAPAIAMLALTGSSRSPGRPVPARWP